MTTKTTTTIIREEFGGRKQDASCRLYNELSEGWELRLLYLESL